MTEENKKIAIMLNRNWYDLRDLDEPKYYYIIQSPRGYGARKALEERLKKKGNQMNVTTLSGRVTKDPIIKTTANGNKCALFGLANNAIKTKDATGETLFMDCATVGKVAEVVEKYVRKGDRICVSGRLTPKTYEDKNGNKRREITLFVDVLDLPEKPKDETPKNELSDIW